MRLEKLRQVDLNLLIIFAVIAEERSATKASARLLLSQPAVSRALSARAFHVSGRIGNSLVFRV
jgi:Bacterial regulatory helix-turn-helix protein, lysR family